MREIPITPYNTNDLYTKVGMMWEKIIPTPSKLTSKLPSSTRKLSCAHANNNVDCGIPSFPKVFPRPIIDQILPGIYLFISAMLQYDAVVVNAT